MKRRAVGFTLIELLVALALLGMIAVILFESLSFSQRSYQRVVQRGEESWQMFAAQRLLRSLLESAHPGQSATDVPAFLGEGDRIVFTAPAPLADGGAGLYRYEISLRPDARGGNDLVIRWHNDFANIEATSADDPPAEEVLIEAVQTARWSYRGPSADQAAHDWADGWPDPQRLPASIRLQIQFVANDARAWPELVVATRVTANAQCEFDTVAQRCRNAS